MVKLTGKAYSFIDVWLKLLLEKDVDKETIAREILRVGNGLNMKKRVYLMRKLYRMRSPRNRRGL